MKENDFYKISIIILGFIIGFFLISSLNKNRYIIFGDTSYNKVLDTKTGNIYKEGKLEYQIKN